MTYVLLAFIQITFNLLKILEIKYSYDENMKMTLLVGFFLAIVWLFSTAIGVSAVIKLDYIMMIDYVISSMFGKYLALKLRKNWKIKNKK
jgi:heme/copper-type cytochrome/quinol oxidase subunit 4